MRLRVPGCELRETFRDTALATRYSQLATNSNNFTSSTGLSK